MKTFFIWAAVGAGVMVLSAAFSGDKIDPLTVVIGGGVLGGVASLSYFFAGPEIGTWIVPVMVGGSAIAVAPKIRATLGGASAPGDAPDAGGA